MYYKITDPEREDFKAFKALREKEMAIEARNAEKVKSLVGDYSAIYGQHGQQNVMRVTQFKGFIFPEGHEPDKSMLHFKNGVWKPNRKSKKGKELDEILLNGLEKSWFETPYEILNLPRPHGTFKLPYIEAFDEVVVLWFGMEIRRRGLTEITKTEFEQILQSEWDKRMAKQL